MEIDKGSGIYRCGDLYVGRAINNAEGQDALASAYLRMKQEGLLEYFFYEDQPLLGDFLFRMLKPNSLTMICLSDEKTRLVPDVHGLGHVTAPLTIGGNISKSEVSMLIFKKHQKRSTTIPFAHMMIEMAFDLNPTLNGLYGCTPEKNPAAVRYITAVGFERCDEPVKDYTTWRGEPCGCFMSWMTRQMWAAKRPWRD